MWIMLHWQRKILRTSRRLLFWAKLLLFSFVSHSLFLFFVLFLYKGNFFSYDVTVSTKFLSAGAPVVFMPFAKRVHKQAVTKNLQSAGASSLKKKKSKSTTLTSFSKPKKKHVAQKSKPKKIQKQKPKPKKKIVAQKKKAQKIVQKKQSKKKIARSIKKKSKNVVAKNKKIVEEKQKPIYVGQVEMEAFRMQDEMQREVVRYWSPPVGLSKDLVCVLKVLVDWSGRVTKTSVAQSSGVLMYDISARTAVSRMQLQQWAHGKEFSITFKQ